MCHSIERKDSIHFKHSSFFAIKKYLVTCHLATSGSNKREQKQNELLPPPKERPPGGRRSGLDFLIPSPRINKLSVCITACLDNQLFCSRKRFRRCFQKKMKRFCKSLSTSSSAQNIPFHAGRNSTLHAVGHLM